MFGVGLCSTTDINLSCRSVIDLRRLLKPAIKAENMGMLASVLTSSESIKTKTNFWNLARDIKRKINTYLESNEVFCPLPLVRAYNQYLLARPNYVPMTVSVTNIGRVNIPQVYGSLALEEISFCPAMASLGGVFAVAVSTFEGKMLLNFVFSEPSISQETMEILTNNVVSCLVDACKKENLTFLDLGDEALEQKLL